MSVSCEGKKDYLDVSARFLSELMQLRSKREPMPWHHHEEFADRDLAVAVREDLAGLFEIWNTWNERRGVEARWEFEILLDESEQRGSRVYALDATLSLF